MIMLKIATHNSCTAEPSKGLLSYLALPFARCQSKTVIEQFQAGCRYFDFRVRLCRDGKYRPAHGLWTCKRTVDDILEQLNVEAINHTYKQDADQAPTYISIIYEGECDYIPGFLTQVNQWIKRYNHLTVVEIGLKKPWKSIYTPKTVHFKYGFIPLNKQHWQTWIPIPKLWQLIYYPKPTFDNTTFKMVDFL